MRKHGWKIYVPIQKVTVNHQTKETRDFSAGSIVCGRCLHAFVSDSPYAIDKPISGESKVRRDFNGVTLTLRLENDSLAAEYGFK